MNENPTKEVAAKVLPYRVKARKDGAQCIFLPKYNVAVAEFFKGSSHSAEEIKRQLDAFPDLLAALEFMVAEVDEYERTASRDGENCYVVVPKAAREAIRKATQI